MSSENLRRYRWEFLRRNPRYVNDYASLREKLGEDPGQFSSHFQRIWWALYVHPPGKVAEEFPGVDLRGVKEGFFALGRFKEKWSISRPANPEDPEPPDFLQSERKERQAVELITPVAKPLEGQSESSNAEFLEVRIALGASKKEILAHVEDILDLYQRLYLSKDFARVREPRFARLDQCLEVYDEVIVKGRSPEQAAAALFPGFAEGGAEERRRTLERVEAFLAEAKRLVELSTEAWPEAVPGED